MPTVTAPGQMIQPPQGGSGLAQALMRAPQMPQLQAPSLNLPPLASLKGLGGSGSPNPTRDERGWNGANLATWGNPNGQPSYGVNATPEQLAGMLQPMQNGQIPQIGEPGSSIPSPTSSSISQLWQQLQSYMGGGNMGGGNGQQ